MKRRYRLFFKIITLCTAVVSIVGLIKFPQTEGRAANLDMIDIYKDPFIIYIYIASIPFFIGLYVTFKLLGFQDDSKISYQINALRTIKYCALTIIVFLIAAIAYIRIFAQGDDPAGPSMVGFIAIILLLGIAKIAHVLQKRFQSKSLQ